jgi:hypothetical protein
MREIRLKYLKRASTVFVIALFLAAALSCSKHSDSATNSSTLIGNWSGVTKDAAGEIVSVDLALEAGDDRMNGELNYGPSRNCTSHAIWVTSQEKMHTFRFSEADGGWCRKLTDGVMELTEIGDGKLSMHVRNSKKDVDETTDIHKQ